VRSRASLALTSVCQPPSYEARATSSVSIYSVVCRNISWGLLGSEQQQVPRYAGSSGRSTGTERNLQNCTYRRTALF
jgi:hypothetical protein